MAKHISGYHKLTDTEGKALLDYFSQPGVLAPPRELYQMLDMLNNYYNPKPTEVPTLMVQVEEHHEAD